MSRPSNKSRRSSAVKVDPIDVDMINKSASSAAATTTTKRHHDDSSPSSSDELHDSKHRNKKQRGTKQPSQSAGSVSPYFSTSSGAGIPDTSSPPISPVTKSSHLRKRKSASSFTDMNSEVDPARISPRSKSPDVQDSPYPNYERLKPSLEFIFRSQHLPEGTSDDYLDFSNAKPLSKPPQRVLNVGKESFEKNDWSNLPKLRPALLETIINYFASCGISTDNNDVIVDRSVFDLITKSYNVLKSQHKDGFEVLIPTPTFGYYIKQCKDSGIATQLIDTPDASYKLTPAALDKALNASKGKVVFLFTNPVNPTGAVYADAEVKALADVLEKHKEKVILTISDEIFRDIVMSEILPISIGRYFKNTFTLNGLSKAHGFEQLGVSFGIGPKEVVSQIEKNFRLIGSSQDMATASLVQNHENKEYLRENSELCKSNISCIKESITSLNNKLTRKFGPNAIQAEIPNPQAASVFLINFSALRGTAWHRSNESEDKVEDIVLSTGIDIAQFLMEDLKIIMMPGEAYCMDPDKMILRMSVAHDHEKIQGAFEKIGEAFNSQKLTEIKSPRSSVEPKDAYAAAVLSHSQPTRSSSSSSSSSSSFSHSL